MIKNYKIWFF